MQESNLLTKTASQQRRSWLQNFARSKMHRMLDKISGGLLEVVEHDGIAEFGSGGSDGLQAEWQIRDPRFYDHLAMAGSLGVAESYLQGYWQADDLTTLLRILCRNLSHLSQSGSGLAVVSKAIARGLHWLDRNTKSGSLRNIQAHYDLSNDFFELFLDPTWMYSSACFDDDGMTLHEASVAKLDTICRKLDLQPSDHVLEIGTGWGGFALYSVGQYGCDLTTTTISQAQYEKASSRIADAGLERKVNLLTTDYRDLTGLYDKLVSIEMIEAVGGQFLDVYFRMCGRLLKPGGRFVLQGIVMPEERYESYRHSVDFIQKYIFPGGFLPSVAAIQESVGRTSDLRLQSVEDLSLSYAKTLEQWRENFFDRIDDVRALGLDDQFIRRWEYYFCYCEAGFREDAVRVVQMVWDKPQAWRHES